MRRRILIAAATVVVMCAGLVTQEVRAQENSRRLTAVVTYIAGPNIYIDLGKEDGIAAGDTLQVHVGQRHGAMRIVSASSTKAVLTFATTAFPISRGDRVDVEVKLRAVVTEEKSVSIPETSSTSARSSIMATTTASGRKQRSSTRVRGRLSLGYRTLSSSTRSSADQPEMSRSYSTPSARLRMTASGLPGRTSINVHVSGSYRQSSYESISPRFLPRLYKISMSKEFDRVPGTVEVGRFYSPFENFSGYWDGILLHLGTDGLGGGFASGFQPDRASERFGANLPKYMAYMHFTQSMGRTSYATDVSFHTVRPRNDLLNHTYLGWRQTLRNGQLGFSTELQADEDPERGEWVMTRLIGRATVPAGPLRLRAGYSQRRPYSIWRSTQVLSYRRDRIDGGLQLLIGGGSVGVGVASNKVEGDDPYVAYSSYFTVPRSKILGVGFSGSSTYWSRDAYTAISASFGITRASRTVSPRASYQYYRTVSPVGVIVTHAVNLSANVRLSRTLGANVQSRTQFGELLFSQTFNLGLWVSF